MIKNTFRHSWNVNWKSKFGPDREASQKQLISLIDWEYKRGNFPDRFRMPSIRTLAKFLGLQREQVANAYSYWITRKKILYTRNRVGTYMYAHPQTRPAIAVASSAEFFFHLKPAGRSAYQEHQSMNILTLGKTYRVRCQGLSALNNLPGAENSLSAANANEIRFLNGALGILRKRALVNNAQQFCLISNGQAIYQVLKMITNPEDLMVMTSVNDLHLVETAAQLRLNLAFSEADQQGMSVTKLEEICREKAVKVVFIRPEPDFPIPLSMDAARWNQVVSLSKQYGFCILVLEEDYEFRCKKTPPVTISLEGGQVIYISPYSKVFRSLHQIGMVAGPENFIAELSKAVKKGFIDQSPGRAFPAALSQSKLGVQVISGNQWRGRGAYKLNILFLNYLERFATLILPDCGTFAFIKFNTPLKGLLAARFMENLLFHEEENFAFEPDEPIDGLRVSLFIQDWASVELPMKMIRDTLESRSREVVGL
ncbi:hypothetical protein OQX61_19125 [Pedobacter sp. PLR]|uniref:hypothetical protein n=1 Tax=Pedobacter sp. PLR TaxID=2994465 RepID=UPI0022465DDF|nr:hypothetical protein [Pedobacter sp. PLR]MCX2453391.1 hypothetical protein [Pedobacter sp. PLR]